MKLILLISAVVLPVLLVSQHAAAKRGEQTRLETAIVVGVDRHVTPSDYVDSPTDAPLQANVYSYDVSIRLDCNLYVGRYESATNYLPSVFAPNHAVDVRFDKHLMYVSLSESDRVVKMSIVSHKRLPERACPANG